MGRLTYIAAIALSAVLSVPVLAQHGGGGHMGGHMGGHGGGFSGHAGGGGFGGVRSGGVRSGQMHSGFSRSGPVGSRGFGRIPSRPGFSGSRFSGSRFSGRGFRGRRGPFIGNRVIGNRGFRRCFGCRGFGYPWGYGYYDPYWWSDSAYDDSSYDEDYERDRATANQMNAQSLEEQRMFRQEQADGDQDSYARSTRPVAPVSDEKPGMSIVPATIVPPTILVFRDQHRQEVQNYAIVGQTLWNFSSQRRQRILLSDLDLVATVAANDERGVTFRVPNLNEGQ